MLLKVVVAACVLLATPSLGQCVLSGGSRLVSSAADAAAFPRGCSVIYGNVDVTCSSGSGITSLSFLSGVSTIQGFLRIKDCSALANVNDLSSLTKISGTTNIGLLIWNCPLLTNLLGLQNLQTISSGGVSIFLNPRLCYVDLIRFDRVIVGATSASSYLLSYSQNQTCLSLNCDSTCSCGWCAGPGQCSITCPASSLAWIAVPIVLSVAAVVLIVIIIWQLHKRGLIGCQCYMSLYRPLATKPPPSPLPAYKAVKGDSRASMAQPPARANTLTAVASPSAATEAAVPMASLPRQLPPVRTGTSPRTSRVAPLASRADPFAVIPPGPQYVPPVVQEAKSTSVCICGKPAEFDCSRCSVQGYCSSECQRNDWKTHRERCKRTSLASTKLVSAPDASLGNCVVCAKPGQFECSRCSGPVYCSAGCQRSHWRQHAPECKRGSHDSTGADPPAPPHSTQEQLAAPAVPAAAGAPFRPLSSQKPSLISVIEVREEEEV